MSESESDSYEDSSSISESSEEEQQDLSELSFAEIAKIRKLDTTGRRSEEARKSRQLLKEQETKKKPRREKDAPIEKSSKVYVSRYQVVVPGPGRVKSKDPRFEGDQLTEEDRAQFRRRYGFIDDMQAEELKQLKKAIRREKNDEEVERLKYAKSVMESRIRSERDMDLRRQIKTEHNREQKLRAEQGRSTYFLKDSELEKRVQTKKFEDLEKQGALERYMAKKRKRQASKDKKATPFKRRKLEEVDDE